MGLPAFLSHPALEHARAAVATCAGLVSQADLARRWGISRQRVGVLVRQPGFPEPATIVNGQPAWLADEANVWREYQDLIAAHARMNASRQAHRAASHLAQTPPRGSGPHHHQPHARSGLVTPQRGKSALQLGTR